MLERPCMCIGQLSQGATVLCVIDVVGLCSNIPHSQGLATLQKFLELRDNKQISSDTLIELAEIVLKKTFLNSIKKPLNRYVKPQLKQSFPVHMVFCLSLT